ncbi:flagellar biosynthesis anti-sigma factor FlgM [Desulfovibrio sp. JC010]|uniref:flagellar biosynthesis anti-sigma factor FlgM n=1 Tax=Desulfovibrio sp. JC010 TaxID=2593641 RepID=UPI0013D63743|nr:flagellar biosynthesis anti-sigma factor FlgM [Desulfovibrio sp. JC010]NDV26171.1 flagellar biosynthesis anti-sigma factor FlgM [Desulfovibrio sp. JC010]
MTFDKTDIDSIMLSCTLSSDEQATSFSEEDSAERHEKLAKLRDQIRAGTYRPAIGEIAINLVRSEAKISGFG